MPRLVLLLAVLLVALGLPARAGGVTVEEVIALSEAGVGDEVIIALLEVEPTAYGVDAAKVLELRQAGVSEPVIAAMIKSDQRSQEQPSVVVIGREAERPMPTVSFIVVPVPIFGVVHPGPGRVRSLAGGTLMENRGFGRFMNDTFPRLANSTFLPAESGRTGSGAP